MVNTPLPTGTQALQTWRRDVDRAIESSGARSLESASITDGILRIVHGGRLIIGDGGTLDLRGGNLILGRGKIDGAALKEQFAASSIDSGSKTVSFSNTTSWKTVISLTVSPPAWADSGSILLTSFQQLTAKHAYVESVETALQARVSGPSTGQAGAFTWMSHVSGTSDVYLVSNLGYMAQIDASGPAVFNVQARGTANGLSKAVTARLSGLAIWTRQN